MSKQKQKDGAHCQFCEAKIQWVTCRFGHGPDYWYRRIPIDAETHAGGVVIFSEEDNEFQMKRAREIKPGSLRYRNHGYVACVQQRKAS